MTKRYAIVRVDNKCPSDFEKIDNLNVCAEPLRYYMNKSVNCKNCRYGDTKEQLIKKVAQVLFRRRLKMYNLIWGGVPSKQEAERYYEVREEIAKEIVEFLGVEE